MFWPALASLIENVFTVSIPGSDARKKKLEVALSTSKLLLDVVILKEDVGSKESGRVNPVSRNRIIVLRGTFLGLLSLSYITISCNLIVLVPSEFFTTLGLMNLRRVSGDTKTSEDEEEIGISEGTIITMLAGAGKGFVIWN